MISAAAAASASTSLTELSLLSDIDGQVERVCRKVRSLLVKTKRQGKAVDKKVGGSAIV